MLVPGTHSITAAVNWWAQDLIPGRMGSSGPLRNDKTALRSQVKLPSQFPCKPVKASAEQIQVREKGEHPQKLPDVGCCSVPVATVLGHYRGSGSGGKARRPHLSSRSPMAKKRQLLSRRKWLKRVPSSISKSGHVPRAEQPIWTALVKGHREMQGRAAVPPLAAKRRVWLSSHFRHDTPCLPQCAVVATNIRLSPL